MRHRTRGRDLLRVQAVSTANPARNGAFSLLELLIVIAIALLLTTMYWGSHSGDRVKEQQAVCLKNLQKLYIAMEIYSNEQNTKFPALSAARTSEEPLDLLVPKYNADLSLFICPGSKDSPLPSGEPLRGHKISYAYYMGRRSSEPQGALISDKQVDTVAKVAGQNLFSSDGKPPGNNHEKNGGNFLFCDGHAEASAAKAAFALPLNDGVVLLNPKP
jgi:prepilin-type processing-associated H-X9-DG protein/prepilin-type N-terminal cleavage/methylation domain-containing protein